jgi:integrase/recombinase XerC
MSEEVPTPDMPRPKRRRKPKRLPRSFPQAEAAALLGAAVNERDRLALLAMFLCGLRVSELTGLQVPDLDFAAGRLMVREGKGAKDRALPLPARLAAPLEAWLAGRTVGYVFPGRFPGSRMSSRTVQRMIKRTAARAGLPDALKPRAVHPHRCRHSFATYLLRSGADIIEVRDLLGHSSISVSQVYLSAEAGRLKTAAERMADSFPGAEKATSSGKSEPVFSSDASRLRDAVNRIPPPEGA